MDSARAGCGLSHMCGMTVDVPRRNAYRIAETRRLAPTVTEREIDDASA